MSGCIYGAQKKVSAPSLFSPDDTSSICFLLGVESLVCPLFDAIPALIGKPWKKVIIRLATRLINIAINQATDQIETAVFCTIDPPPLPSDITYDEVFLWLASYIPIIGGFADSDPLLNKITALYLYQKYFEYCECAPPPPPPVPKKGEATPSNPRISESNKCIPRGDIDAANRRLAEFDRLNSEFPDGALLLDRGGDRLGQSRGDGFPDLDVEKIFYDVFLYPEIINNVPTKYRLGELEAIEGITDTWNGQIIKLPDEYFGCITISPVFNRAGYNYLRRRYVYRTDYPDTYPPVAQFLFQQYYKSSYLASVDLSNCDRESETNPDGSGGGCKRREERKPAVLGCTDPYSPKFKPDATVDDGSCKEQPCEEEKTNVYVFSSCGNDRTIEERSLFKSGPVKSVNVYVFSSCGGDRTIEQRSLFDC